MNLTYDDPVEDAKIMGRWMRHNWLRILVSIGILSLLLYAGGVR